MLTRHQTTFGARWANEGFFLPPGFGLSDLLELRRAAMAELLKSLPQDERATGDMLAPLDRWHEVWAAGVTYLRSRDARRAESATASVYDKVYDAARPELFFKATGWRVVGDRGPIRIRRDSRWNVPEPELTLVINRHAEIVGYCAGNDLSSRDIEGENPLYLPQAKIYTGSCALGPGILLCEPGELALLAVRLQVRRQDSVLFQGETSVARMKRDLAGLVSYLMRELDFPYGVLLMTGTGIVPPDDFSLQCGDVVQVQVGSMLIENRVADNQ
jgi:2-dehydro-3-deoxy-D-arabinonate dehydratase